MLVVTPNNADVVHLREIDSFAKTDPNYSFLVPEGKEDFYRDKLVTSLQRKRINAPPNFEIKRISADRQAIRLELGGDGALVTEYEASDKSVFPKTSKMYGPGFLIFPAFYSFMIAVAVAILARLGWEGYKFRNRKTAV